MNSRTFDSQTAKVISNFEVSSAATEVDDQSMDAIDNVADFLRFVAISTRVRFEREVI